MKRKFKILHLSDIHLHDNRNGVIGNLRGNKTEVVNAFNNLDLTDEGVDLIAVTGDIFDGPYINVRHSDVADSPERYSRFFFHKLQEISKNILFSYGNHDLKLFYKNKTLTDLKSCFHYRGDRNEVNEFLQKFFGSTDYNTSITDCSTQLLKYAEFIKEFLDKENHSVLGYNLKKLESSLFINFDHFVNTDTKEFSTNDYFTFGISHFKEHNVLVVRINTSFQNICSEFLDGRLTIGTFQLQYLKERIDEIKENNKHCYVVTMMHNAFNSLAYSDVHFQSEEKPSFISVISQFSDLILCGHEHGELPPSLIHLESYQLKTGGLLNNDVHSPRNSYSVIELDFEKRELKRKLHVFDNMATRFILVNPSSPNKPLPFNNYKEFELYPKKARDLFVAQQRDIEDYLDYIKDFQLAYKEEHPITDTNKELFFEKINKILLNVPTSEVFFKAKEQAFRSFITVYIKERGIN